MAFVTLNVGLRRKDAAKIAGKLDQSTRKIFPILAASELQVWIILQIKTSDVTTNLESFIILEKN